MARPFGDSAVTWHCPLGCHQVSRVSAPFVCCFPPKKRCHCARLSRWLQRKPFESDNHSFNLETCSWALGVARLAPWGGRGMVGGLLGAEDTQSQH